jgi:hypothetical protein
MLKLNLQNYAGGSAMQCIKDRRPNLSGSWLCMALVIGFSLLGLNLLNFCFFFFLILLDVSSSLYCFTVNHYLYLVIFNIIFLFVGKINIYSDFFW